MPGEYIINNRSKIWRFHYRVCPKVRSKRTESFWVLELSIWDTERTRQGRPPRTRNEVLEGSDRYRSFPESRLERRGLDYCWKNPKTKGKGENRVRDRDGELSHVVCWSFEFSCPNETSSTNYVNFYVLIIRHLIS